jgi:hypothetical protein
MPSDESAFSASLVLVDEISAPATVPALPTLLGFDAEEFDSESTSTPSGTADAASISISAVLLQPVDFSALRCAALAADGRNRRSAAFVPRTAERRVASRAAMTSNDVADLGAGTRAGGAATVRVAADDEDDENDEEEDEDTADVAVSADDVADNSVGSVDNDADDSSGDADRDAPVTSVSEATVALLCTVAPFARVAVSDVWVFGGGRRATRRG